MMCLVHDLAEAHGERQAVFEVPQTEARIVGDIAPREGITSAEKRRLEEVSLSTLSQRVSFNWNI
jgi:hypothetical protein